MKLTLAVITLNEAANLERCLRSGQSFADEILIVDSGSTDATPEIAAAHGARFIHQDWLGFVGQKNKAIELATHEWIFSIDADEEASPELQREIQALKTGSEEGRAGHYAVSRLSYYEGRWIRHGDWVPDRVIRLFPRKDSQFIGGKVHESLRAPGRLGRLRAPLHHYSYTDVLDHWKRCGHYARLWGESAFEQGKTAGPLAPWTHMAFKAFRGLVLKRGFLDGRAGWQIAMLSAAETYLKYSWLKHLQNARPGNDS